MQLVFRKELSMQKILKSWITAFVALVGIWLGLFVLELGIKWVSGVGFGLISWLIFFISVAAVYYMTGDKVKTVKTAVSMGVLCVIATMAIFSIQWTRGLVLSGFTTIPGIVSVLIGAPILGFAWTRGNGEETAAVEI